MGMTPIFFMMSVFMFHVLTGGGGFAGLLLSGSVTFFFSHRRIYKVERAIQREV